MSLTNPLAACFSFALLLLISSAAGGLYARRNKAGTLTPGSFAYLLGPALVTVLHLFYYESVWAAFKEQNWARLARTIALFSGFSLYPDPETGPVMTTIYGPISALAYWPSTWAETPSAAVQLGLVVSILFFFLPVLAVLFQKREGEKRLWIFTLLIFSCFTFLATVVSSTKDSAYTIHADAPALGFGLLACLFLYRLKPEETSWRPLALSAVFTMLSIGAKQTALPLLAALPLYVYFLSGARAFWRYALCLFAAGCALLLYLWLFFGLAPAFYYLIYLPSLHPVKEGGAGMVAKALWRIAREALLASAAALPVFWCSLQTGGRKKTFRAWVENNPWFLFFWVGLCMTPLALGSSIKIGGSNNTISFVTYFLLTGTASGLLQMARRYENDTASRARSVVRVTVLTYVVVLMLVVAPRIFYKIMEADERDDFGREAYEYLLSHPGTVYFPRISLVHLMAEKKQYHAADGLMDRTWAGLPVGAEQFGKHIPEDLKFIAFSGEDHRDYLPLEGFSTGYLNTKELPSFVVYPREEALLEELNT